MENGTLSTQATTKYSNSTENPLVQSHGTKPRQKIAVIGAVIGVITVLALFGLAIFSLAKHPAAAQNVRDIFIIFMALEFLLIGVALIILIVQLANLINLLQNEVKPILESTNETANTLRGTAAFLSQNLSEPVIQLNSYIAALKRAIELLGMARKKK